MKVARPIGPADMEFYESASVLRMALILSGKDQERFDALSHRARQRWLDKAAKATCDFYNDQRVAERLLPLAINYQQRLAA